MLLFLFQLEQGIVLVNFNFLSKGQHLAIIETKVIVMNVFSSFKISIKENYELNMVNVSTY